MPAVNDNFTATVRDITSEGSGVVEHRDGRVFFVPGVWVGEVVTVKVTGFRKRVGFAELVAIESPSPARVEPLCPHQGLGVHQCGGCPWAGISYSAQLEVKAQRVRQTLARLSVTEQVKPIWASPKIYGYRNRAQFKTDGRQLGYVAQGSNRLAAITQCPILTDKNRHTLAGLLAKLPNPHWRPQRRQVWNSIDIDEETDSESVELNRRRPFRQANDDQNQRMKDWVGAHLKNTDRSARVLELFAGSGNFTRVISAAGFGSVLAVEGVETSLDVLAAEQLPGVSTRVCDLFSARAVGELGRHCEGVEVLVLDPPRDGFREVKTLLDACPQLRRVLYVSCNLATFTRDAGVLQDNGFRVQEVQPLDQFPHTPHVELLALLERAC